MKSKNERLNVYRGTPGHVAPEVYDCKDDSTKSYNPFLADIFSLGIVFSQILFGKRVSSVVLNYEKDKFKDDIIFKQIVICCEKNANDRKTSMEELEKYFNHQNSIFN